MHSKAMQDWLNFTRSVGRMVRPELGLDGYLEGITSVSKTIDLGVEGKCTGRCEGAFLWTIDKIYPDGAIRPLTMNEMNDASKGNSAPVTFDDESVDDISKSQFSPFLTEFDSKTLIISSNFLTRWDNAFKLLVCFTYTPVLGSGTRVCKRFHPMDPPVLGSCHVDPTGEITKDTTVCISCDGMNWDKRPVLYRLQRKCPYSQSKSVKVHL